MTARQPATSRPLHGAGSESTDPSICACLVNAGTCGAFTRVAANSVRSDHSSRSKVDNGAPTVWTRSCRISPKIAGGGMQGAQRAQRSGAFALVQGGAWPASAKSRLGIGPPGPGGALYDFWGEAGVLARVATAAVGVCGYRLYPAKLDLSFGEPRLLAGTVTCKKVYNMTAADCQ